MKWKIRSLVRMEGKNVPLPRWLQLLRAAIDRANRWIEPLDRKRLALGVLLAVGAVILIMQNDKNGFEKGHHGFLSSHGATLARSLTWQTHLLMYARADKSEDGEITYSAYNRFPAWPFLAIKAAMIPAGSNLAMQIHLARQLMNLFFFASIVCVFLAVHRLSGSAFVGLATALLSHSSWFMVFYSDMIFNDIPALFGFNLVFHGIVTFMLDQRKRQLFIKSLLAICMGWQPYALLLPFVLIGMGRECWHSRSVRRALAGTHMKLGASVLLLGIILLLGNLLNELMTVRKSLPDLPTIQSLTLRTGLDNSFEKENQEVLAWKAFLTEQRFRVEALTRPFSFESPKPSKKYFVAPLLILILALALLRNRWILLMLITSGPFWALPMRNFVAFHDFQTVYYVGIPVVIYYALASWFNRWLRGLGLLFAIAGVVFFLHSFMKVNILKSQLADMPNIVTRDFQIINSIVGTGKVIAVDGPYEDVAIGNHAPSFYLAGNYFGTVTNAEFVISRTRDPKLQLTPTTLHTHLLLNIQPLIRPAFLKARAPWNVYLKESYLLYENLQPIPAGDDTNVFLEIWPKAAKEGQPASLRRLFRTQDISFTRDNKSFILLALPTQDIGKCHTGQIAPDNKIIWEVTF